MDTVLESQNVAYWYLRLNGFLTIPNFVVHPDTGGLQRTDVDILGVRFPYRAELAPIPMQDDCPFVDIQDRPYLIIAEVKRGLCDLNGPWTDPHHGNMERVLRAVGAFPVEEVPTVAAALYDSGVFSSTTYYLSLCAFGERSNPTLTKRYPQIPQKLWNDVLEFIYNRFTTYRNQKSSHPQWDKTGHELYRCADRAASFNEFATAIELR